MQHSKIIQYVLIFSITVVMLMACNFTELPLPEPQPIRFAYSLWPGYFPAAIAQEKGFFAAQGVKVEITFSEDVQAQIANLSAGKYDGMALALGSMVQVCAANRDVRMIIAIDQSDGADAVIAKPAIPRVAELKGKVIGTTLGDFGELFVNKMLEANGITRDQVTLVNVGGEKIPVLLQSGAIQAGHTWEPYVSQAVKAGGNILFTSKQTPGLIPDVIVFQGNVLRDRPADIRAFVRAWFQAVDYWLAFPEEGNRIIAKALKIKPETISLDGIKLLTLSDNRQAFTPGNTTESLYHTTQLYFSFYQQIGNLGSTSEINRFLDPSFL